jgi:hypothetical protein
MTVQPKSGSLSSLSSLWAEHTLGPFNVRHTGGIDAIWLQRLDSNQQRSFDNGLTVRPLLPFGYFGMILTNVVGGGGVGPPSNALIRRVVSTGQPAEMEGIEPSLQPMGLRSAIKLH